MIRSRAHGNSKHAVFGGFALLKIASVNERRNLLPPVVTRWAEIYSTHRGAIDKGEFTEMGWLAPLFPAPIPAPVPMEVDAHSEGSGEDDEDDDEGSEEEDEDEQQQVGGKVESGGVGMKRPRKDDVGGKPPKKPRMEDEPETSAEATKARKKNRVVDFTYTHANPGGFKIPPSICTYCRAHCPDKCLIDKLNGACEMCKLRKNKCERDGRQPRKSRKAPAPKSKEVVEETDGEEGGKAEKAAVALKPRSKGKGKKQAPAEKGGQTAATPKAGPSTEASAAKPKSKALPTPAIEASRDPPKDKGKGRAVDSTTEVSAVQTCHNPRF